MTPLLLYANAALISLTLALIWKIISIKKNESKKHQIIFNENQLLKQSLRQQNNILNTLPLPIWTRGKDLEINYFNNAYSSIISNLYSESDFSNEISKKEKTLAAKSQKTKLPQKNSFHIILKNKRHLYEFEENPIYGSNDVVGFAHDVTTQEKLHKELKMHISAQSDLLETTANASAIYDSHTRLMFFNQAFVKLWNLDESWLVTHPTYGELLELLRERRQIPEQLDFRAFKNEQLEFFTALRSPHNDFFFLPDGRYLRVITIPYTLGGVLFSYEDITDKLALEKEYKTLSAAQKETIDHLSEGISVFSESGQLQLSNKQFSEIWNLDPVYLKSKPHFSVIIEYIEAKITSKNFAEKILHAINSRKRNKAKITTKDHKTIEALFVPLPDGATMISYHDITDSIIVEKTLIEKNQALQDADKLKTEFLANVSYELRSPLTSILGFAQALDKNYCGKLNPLQAEYISNIHDSSQYLMTLINDLLDLASIDAGYIKLNVTKFKIYDFIESILELVKERAKKRKIKLSFSCDDNAHFLEGDIKILKQVLFKIISNAIDNSTPNQSVKFIVQNTENNNIVFTVDDCATKLSHEEYAHLFDPFKKFDVKHINTRSSSLGMALVKNFIMLHHGKIDVKIKKTKGINFSITLPSSQNNIIEVAEDKKLEIESR